VSDATNPPDSLLGLEERLRTLSHSDEAMRLVQEFAASLGKTKSRQNVFNALGALVRQPISYKEVLSKGLIDPQEDVFSLLQGDVVSTDAAFFLGERLVGLKYVVGNAIEFDGIAQVKLPDLLLATRHASLSLVGWRMFGSYVRSIMARAAESEVKIRAARAQG
jgi:hypothetical protein